MAQLNIREVSDQNMRDWKYAAAQAGMSLKDWVTTALLAAAGGGMAKRPLPKMKDADKNKDAAKPAAKTPAPRKPVNADAVAAKSRQPAGRNDKGQCEHGLIYCPRCNG